MSDFYNEQIIKKSRKEHKCDTCRSIIEKGSSYVRVFGVWQGEMFKNKHCLICNEILKKEWDTGWYDDGIDVQQFLWDIDPNKEYFEMLQKIPNKSQCIKKLLAAWEDELLEIENNVKAKREEQA